MSICVALAARRGVAGSRYVAAVVVLTAIAAVTFFLVAQLGTESWHMPSSSAEIWVSVIGIATGVSVGARGKRA